ncbi:MAG: hypothetical protein M1827_001464 [Pycnora praestabilis]|nr:MAG: hypothetical protein M1827_001464 [Pycnora praestabilis]
MTKTTNSKSGDTASTHSSECSICLMSIAFLCPNCRAVADLEADVDDPAAYEAWEEENDGVAEPAEAEEVLPDSPRASTGSQSESESARRSMAVSDSPEDEVMNLANDEVLSTMMGSVALAEQRQSSEAERSPSMYETAESPILPHSPPSSSSLSRRVPSSVGPLNIAQRKSSASRKNSNPTLRARNDNTSQANQLVAAAGGLDSPSRAASSAELLGPEGPMTPRNDAGPFVFDGSAGRNTGRRIAASLGEIAVESAPTQ